MPATPTYLENAIGTKKIQIRIQAILLCVIISSVFLFPLMVRKHEKNRVFSVKVIHPNFIGREKIFKSLYQYLSNDQRDYVQKVLIWGEGGVGKSEIAVAFANKNAANFPIIYWIDSSTEEILFQSYQALAEKLSFPVNLNAPLESLIKQVNYCLSKLEKKWLLIYDNVEFEIPMPDSGKGSILITSRTKHSTKSDWIFKVPRFSVNESIKLISSILDPTTTNTSDWKKLAEKFEGLPIALGEGLRYLKEHPFISIDQYLEAYDADCIRTVLSHEADYRYSTSFGKMFEKSIRNLEKTTPYSYEWLSICSYLHPDKIPISWIDKWFTAHGKGIEGFHSEKNRMLSNLVNQGFFRYNQIDNTLSIHRIKQEFIKFYQQSTANSMKALELLINPILDQTYLFDFENHHLSKEELSLWVINACWFLENSENVPNTIKKVLLLNALGNYYNILESNWNKAERYFVKALEIEGELIDTHSNIRAEILANLSFCVFFKRDYELAKKLVYEAYELAEKVENYHLMLCLLMDLNRISVWMNNRKKNQEYLSQYQYLKNKLCIEEDPLREAEYFKWFGIFHEDGGDYQTALLWYKKALEANEFIYQQRPNIQKMYISSHIGKSHYHLSNYKLALSWFKKTESIQRFLYENDNHIEIVTTQKWFSKIQYKLRRYHQALRDAKKGIKISEILYGKENMDKAYFLDIIGDIYIALGNTKRGLENYELALNITKQTKDIPDPKFIPSLLKKIQKSCKR